MALEDICFVVDGGGRCAENVEYCSLPYDEFEIFVAGLPCTSYSFCNPKRFKRNCFTDLAGKSFFEMRRFMFDRKHKFVEDNCAEI